VPTTPMRARSDPATRRTTLSTMQSIIRPLPALLKQTGYVRPQRSHHEFLLKQDRSALGHAMAQVDSDMLPSCGCCACRRRDRADTEPAPSAQPQTDRPAALIGPSALTPIPERFYEISVPEGARLAWRIPRPFRSYPAATSRSTPAPEYPRRRNPPRLLDDQRHAGCGSGFLVILILPCGSIISRFCFSATIL
jgi:hypothetical protein